MSYWIASCEHGWQFIDILTVIWNGRAVCVKRHADERSDPENTTKRNFEIFKAPDFIAAALLHIPPTVSFIALATKERPANRPLLRPLLQQNLRPNLPHPGPHHPPAQNHAPFRKTAPFRNPPRPPPPPFDIDTMEPMEPRGRPSRNGPRRRTGSELVQPSEAPIRVGARPVRPKPRLAAQRNSARRWPHPRPRRFLTPPEEARKQPPPNQFLAWREG